MERSNQRNLQHLALPTAAARIYIGLHGSPPDPHDFDAMAKALDDIASALTQIATLYVSDGQGMPRELEYVELIGGTFSRGARVFTTRDGEALRGLTIRRGEMEFAISVMKGMAPKW